MATKTVYMRKENNHKASRPQFGLSCPTETPDPEIPGFRFSIQSQSSSFWSELIYIDRIGVGLTDGQHINPVFQRLFFAQRQI